MSPPTKIHRLGQGPLAGVVYHCISANGRSLYVGLSLNLKKRLRSHRESSSWWVDVASIHVFEVRDGQRLRDVERHVISSNRPVHNRIGNPDWQWSYTEKAYIPRGRPRSDDDIVSMRRYQAGTDVTSIREAS